MRTHLSLVNQKLGFAAALISLAKSFPDDSIGIRKTQRQACYEASVFQLYAAYHFYLRELADNNRIKNPEYIKSIDALCDALSQSGNSPSEANELRELIKDEKSWLSQVLVQYSHVFASPSRKKEKKAFGNDNLIDIVELDQIAETSAQAFEFDVIEEWLIEFRALIARQRETSAEY